MNEVLTLYSAYVGELVQLSVIPTSHSSIPVCLEIEDEDGKVNAIALDREDAKALLKRLTELLEV